MSNTLFNEQPQPKVIRSLWWKQPYASLMLHGKIETRTYPTNVRGKVLICACKKPYDMEILHEISGSKQYHRIWNEYDMLTYVEENDIYGKAIAIGNLIDCRPMTPQDEHRCFVAYRKPWTEDVPWKGMERTSTPYKVVRKQLYCYLFEDVRTIEPFAISGKRGWGILTEEQKSKIKIV